MEKTLVAPEIKLLYWLVLKHKNNRNKYCVPSDLDTLNCFVRNIHIFTSTSGNFLNIEEFIHFVVKNLINTILYIYLNLIIVPIGL